MILWFPLVVSGRLLLLSVRNYFWLPGVGFWFFEVGSLAIVTCHELLRSIVADMGE